jgi:acyl carrier protein
VPEASLAGDLGADDMARIELAEALEDELGERTVGFSIDDEDLAELDTVAELVDYVVGRLAETSAESDAAPTDPDRTAAPTDPTADGTADGPDRTAAPTDADRTADGAA